MTPHKGGRLEDALRKYKIVMGGIFYQDKSDSYLVAVRKEALPGFETKAKLITVSGLEELQNGPSKLAALISTRLEEKLAPKDGN